MLRFSEKFVEREKNNIGAMFGIILSRLQKSRRVQGPDLIILKDLGLLNEGRGMNSKASSKLSKRMLKLGNTWEYQGLPSTSELV